MRLDRRNARSHRSSKHVTFPGTGIQVAGTVHVPAGDPGTRHPAVVLLHGSGPQAHAQKSGDQLNMGFGFQIPVFDEIAEVLADQGFVLLRYDKRSCGPFNGCADSGYVLDPATTVESFIGDAVDAVDYLAARPAVDPQRLFVIGHSQGGTFVPSVLEARPQVRAGVMLSANHRPIDAILEAETAFARTILGGAGVPAEMVAAVAATLDELVGESVASRAGTIQREGAGGTSVAFWKSALAHGDAVPAVAARIDRPLVLLGDTYDWNVPPAEMEA